MAETVERLPLALDLVEEGTTASAQEVGAKRVDKRLPEGVTSGHLYRDVVRIA